MIQPDKIRIFRCKAYAPDGTYLGNLNEYEFNDLRIKIKEQHEDGYYMIYQKQIIPISNNGRLSSWPNGFYDITDHQLDKLLRP